MKILDFSSVKHYGVKHRSGRYPWGSGEEPYQHMGDFASRVDTLRASGLTDKQIADAMHMSTPDLKRQWALKTDMEREMKVSKVKSLKHQGYNNSEIARMMGINESSVRSYLDIDKERKMNAAKETANLIEEQIKKKGCIDVGAGVEQELGISRGKLDEALLILEQRGYNHFGISQAQTTNMAQRTTYNLIADKDINQKMVYKDPTLVQPLDDYTSHDMGRSFQTLEYPASIDSKRVAINYADTGNGKELDGTMYIRRGCKDLDLGDANYAQVRIMVDGDHYLKGMAMYKDGLPDGVDIQFNTNKNSNVPKMDVLKKCKNDPDNPFGADLKASGQSYYDDPNGKYIDPVTGKHQSLSAINKLKEEGDWGGQGHGQISAQFLSKQPKELAKRQLDITYADKLAEFDEIKNYTNPTVKRKLLKDFADACDKSAVDLKAAALPRQKWEVILPVESMKEDEVYAPNFKDGEKVALVRFPHAGRFEIPICRVNNKQPEAKRLLGNDTDAIGISMKTADRLSGADFDGDTVVCIPTGGKINIKSQPRLKGLEGFDTGDYYTPPKVDKHGNETYGYKLLNKTYKQNLMGQVSNLITDMTIKGASDEELTRAVKHSMVVIDAEKHKLDYKRSERENGINELKKKYQGHIGEDGKYHEKTATLLSRAKGEVSVDKNVGSTWINDPSKPLKGTISKTTGKPIKSNFYDPDRPDYAVMQKREKQYYTDKKGKTVQRTTKSTQMAETDDARTLSTGTPMEELYANHANRMKALANDARREYTRTGRTKVDPQAKEKYATEVASLKASLARSELNAPRERQATIIANSVIKAKKDSNPDMTKEEIKKEKARAIAAARASVSASGKDSRVPISDREWEAIENHALSDSLVERILSKADSDRVNELARPKEQKTLSDAQKGRIKAMYKSYTLSQIADALGVSTSTVAKVVKE